MIVATMPATGSAIQNEMPSRNMSNAAVYAPMPMSAACAKANCPA